MGCRRGRLTIEKETCHDVYKGWSEIVRSMICTDKNSANREVFLGEGRGKRGRERERGRESEWEKC